MNTPRPIVFDLDGTLIDSAPDIHGAVNGVLRGLGAPPLSLDEVRSFIGGGVDLLWRRVIDARGLRPEDRADHVAAFMTRYHDATALTRLFDGVLEALGRLADDGHRLGICTNKPMAPTINILRHFGIAHLFTHIIAGDSLPQRKPAAEPLLAALAGLNDDPAAPRGLYVGDSEFDAACAQNAGVPLLLFTRGYRVRRRWTRCTTPSVSATGPICRSLSMRGRTDRYIQYLQYVFPCPICSPTMQGIMP